MRRECAALSILAATPACSLILDFDQKPPADAAIDAVYTQAECDYMEPNDAITAPAMIDPATDMGPAAICAVDGGEDKDFYKFAVTASPVTINVSFTNRPGGDLDIKLHDATGNMVSQSRGFGDGEMITCPAASPSCPMLTPGDYILEVFPAVVGSVNSYTFSITQ